MNYISLVGMATLPTSIYNFFLLVQWMKYYYRCSVPSSGNIHDSLAMHTLVQLSVVQFSTVYMNSKMNSTYFNAELKKKKLVFPYSMYST
jgi:hypothetical protein